MYMKRRIIRGGGGGGRFKSAVKLKLSHGLQLDHVRDQKTFIPF